MKALLNWCSAHWKALTIVVGALLLLSGLSILIASVPGNLILFGTVIFLVGITSCADRSNYY